MAANVSIYNITPAPSTLPCKCDLSINNYIYNNNATASTIHVGLAIFAVFSNAVIILTVIKTESLHRPANILLCGVAFGDFLVGLVVQPIMVVRLLFHNAGVNCCSYNVVGLLYQLTAVTLTCGSFIQVCVVCWDRYKAVSRPLLYRSTVTNKKMIVTSSSTWLLWITFMVVYRFLPLIMRLFCGGTVLASFILICVVSQLATVKAMRRHNNQIAAVIGPPSDTYAREKKMVVTLRWILGTSVLSALPQLLYVILSAINGRDNLGHDLASPWVKLAMCLSSSINPLIYFWRHGSMRRAAKQLIKC